MEPKTKKFGSVSVFGMGSVSDFLVLTFGLKLLNGKKNWPRIMKKDLNPNVN